MISCSARCYHCCSPPPAMRHHCGRCGKPFIIYNSGQYQSVEQCCYHEGRPIKKRGELSRTSECLPSLLLCSSSPRVRDGRGHCLLLLRQREWLQWVHRRKGPPPHHLTTSHPQTPSLTHHYHVLTTSHSHPVTPSHISPLHSHTSRCTSLQEPVCLVSPVM